MHLLATRFEHGVQVAFRRSRPALRRCPMPAACLRAHKREADACARRTSSRSSRSSAPRVWTGARASSGSSSSTARAFSTRDAGSTAPSVACRAAMGRFMNSSPAAGATVRDAATVPTRPIALRHGSRKGKETTRFTTPPVHARASESSGRSSTRRESARRFVGCGCLRRRLKPLSRFMSVVPRIAQTRERKTLFPCWRPPKPRESTLRHPSG